jgi:hypothetical protein
MACRAAFMQSVIVIVALGLFAVLVSSVWLRRADLQFSGESGTMLLGLLLCLLSVALIVLVRW